MSGSVETSARPVPLSREESSGAEDAPSSATADLLEEIDRMQRCHAAREGGDLGMWRELGAKHVALIRSQGFERFKRTVNFEYSQWAVTGYRDPKSARLARQLLAKGRIPWGLVRTKARIRSPETIVWDAGPATARRIDAYRVYLGLLWDYARIEDRLGCLDLREPAVGSPLEIERGGRLITQDQALSSLELNTIARVCDLTSVRAMAEIGAGYGRLAWAALSLFPAIRYTIVDIPPALAVSQAYLRVCLGEERILPFRDGGVRHAGPAGTMTAPRGAAAFLLPHQMEDVPDRSIDLLVNVSSFDEMPPPQVERYFHLIDRKVRGWLYLKGYVSNRRTGWSYRSFPYRNRWKRIFERVDPANGAFVEQVFSLHAEP